MELQDRSREHNVNARVWQYWNIFCIYFKTLHLGHYCFCACIWYVMLNCKIRLWILLLSMVYAGKHFFKMLLEYILCSWKIKLTGGKCSKKNKSLCALQQLTDLQIQYLDCQVRNDSPGELVACGITPQVSSAHLLQT